MEMIKTYNLKDFFAGKLQGQYEKVYTAEMNAQKYVAILQPVCFSLSYIPRLICALYGGQLVVKGEMGIGSVIAILQLFEYVVEPTVYLPFVMNRIHRAIAAIERVSEVFSMQEERMDGRLKPVCTGEEELPKREGVAILRLENVAFGYDPERRVLNDVNFELKQGKLTALVGASGGGKSTIINLLTGLYECDAGRIELFGVDLRQLTLPAIREQIAVVSQDTYLFPATIAENIRYGRLDATMEEVIAAARAVYVDEFVENLPAGYQTMVGEGGSSLSGGQRQRIAMARAVLKNAPILLLDEPTASLDHHTETLIQQSLERLMVGRTVLVIAHRLSTIIRADQILVLDNGQIVEAGTHETLLGQRGLYERLTNMQSSVEEGRAC
jgi:ABC-type multidrug transport system fused ATPase/permease subunit